MGKLHDQMREDLLLKAYSPYTLRSSSGCVRHFVDQNSLRAGIFDPVDNMCSTPFGIKAPGPARG